MNQQEAVDFLLSIATEIKRSFDTPVILFTKRDYADNVFKFLVEMEAALLRNACPKEIADIVSTFHIDWLQAVQDIENIEKSLKDTPRQTILDLIDYSIECTENRYKYVHKYIDKLKPITTDSEIKFLHVDLAIIKEKREAAHGALREKQNYLRCQADQEEFNAKIHDEIEELMTWLDNLNDNLAIQFCKFLNLQEPLEKHLSKVLYDIINDFSDSKNNTRGISNNNDNLSKSVHRHNFYNDLEINGLIKKIKALEARVIQLKTEKSSALNGLQQRLLYLQERLQSLESIKLSVNHLKGSSDASGDDSKHVKKIMIFNHSLPHHERCQLIERLIELWNTVIRTDQNRKSIISILSATDLKEDFVDDIGQFSVDKYGRKIYNDDGEKLYQVNEKGDLVSLDDDDRHVYFYDECGRYYVERDHQRVYKAHNKASEYLMNTDGYLMKYMEETDGIQYYFDQLGRYYINSKGSRVYRDADSDSEYEHDGFGNLVKLKDGINYHLCSDKSIALSETNYLQLTIGNALKKCIANVVIHQPVDPILCLANNLEEYQRAMKEHEKEVNNYNELLKERAKLASDLEQSVNVESTPSDIGEYMYLDNTIELYESQYDLLQPLSG